MQKRSYGSVTVFWLDRARAVRELEDRARRLRAERSEVERVVLFGSLAEGRAVPSSDADVLVLARGRLPRLHERGAPYEPYFARLGIPVDLFVYTPEEAERVPLARQALRQGRPLA